MERTDKRTYKEFYAIGEKFHYPVRYKPLRVIENGAHGQTVSATDTETGEQVAIQRYHVLPMEKFNLECTLREICLLRYFKHDNIVSLIDIYIPPPWTAVDFEEVYLVTKLMDTNLHDVIASGQPLSDNHVLYITYQLLTALHHIHDAKVVHRYLSPSRVLINADCSLKIGSFQWASDVLGFRNSICVVPWRCYMAPEVSNTLHGYTAASDMWSVGCMIAQLIKKEPLFPGSGHANNLTAVVEQIGSPTQGELNYICEEGRKYVHDNLMGKKRQSLNLAGISDSLKDLLEKIFVFDPAKRITVEEAINHPYFPDGDEDECTDGGKVHKFKFKYDVGCDINEDMLRKAIWNEAQLQW